MTLSDIERINGLYKKATKGLRLPIRSPDPGADAQLVTTLVNAWPAIYPILKRAAKGE